MNPPLDPNNPPTPPDAPSRPLTPADLGLGPDQTESTTPATNQITTAPVSVGSQIFDAVWAGIRGIISWFVVPALIVGVLHFFVFQAFHVVGHSMIPTLDQSDYLIISKVDATLARLSKLRGGSGQYIPERGEIIVFKFPNDPKYDFVKRVVGLPGERVVVKQGKLTVYNTQQPQGFNPDTGYLTSDPITQGEVDQVVADDSVFVVGDNRSPNGSYDSRDWGDLPSRFIIGKAVLRLLPLNKFRVIDKN